MKKTVYPPNLLRNFKYFTDWTVNEIDASTINNLVNYLSRLVLEVPCGHFYPSRSFYYEPSEEHGVTQHVIVTNGYPAHIVNLFPIYSADVLMVTILPGSGTKVLVRVSTNWPDVFETAPKAILEGLQKIFVVESDRGDLASDSHPRSAPTLECITDERDRELAELYCDRTLTVKQAAKKAFLDEGTFGNYISKLRTKYPDAHIPYRNELIAKKQKKGT